MFDLFDRPFHRGSYTGIVIVSRPGQALQRGLVSRLPQYNRRIAFQSTQLAAVHRRAATLLFERLVIHRQPLPRIDGRRLHDALAVPRANILTDVAAIKPFAHHGHLLFRQRPFGFNRQIANALAGIQNAGGWKGICGTLIQASCAGPAMLSLMRFIGMQFHIRQQRAQHHIAAAMLVDKHRVLADPPQPRPSGEITFQQRRCITHTPGPTSRHFFH